MSLLGLIKMPARGIAAADNLMQKAKSMREATATTGGKQADDAFGMGMVFNYMARDTGEFTAKDGKFDKNSWAEARGVNLDTAVPTADIRPDVAPTAVAALDNRQPRTVAPGPNPLDTTKGPSFGGNIG